VAEPIPIIGGTGALGYGLAVRLLRAGQTIVIGSRKPERAEEAAKRLREAVPPQRLVDGRRRRGTQGRIQHYPG
jgi:predicted dinucleotide-binding enzyme